MTATPSTLQSEQNVAFTGKASLPLLTVIVPVAPNETCWTTLLADLSEQLPADSEVVLATTRNSPVDLQDTAGSCRFRVEWLTTRRGRGPQMNDAARAARGAFLWFLHADSRLPEGCVASLVDSVDCRPRDLHYYGLRFHDGPRWLRFNEVGVSVRCRLFGLPFGDQGFCISRELFWQLGGFDEQAAFGEDHLFVWKTRRHGVRLHRVPGVLLTSGRKYADRGWMRTTCRHMRLTVAQAFSQLARSDNA